MGFHAENSLHTARPGQAVLEHIADVRRAIIKGSTLAVLHRINRENLREEKNM